MKADCFLTFCQKPLRRAPLVILAARIVSKLPSFYVLRFGLVVHDFTRAGGLFTPDHVIGPASRVEDGVDQFGACIGFVH